MDVSTRENGRPTKCMEKVPIVLQFLSHVYSHRQGEMTWPDGKKFAGTFKYDMMQGKVPGYCSVQIIHVVQGGYDFSRWK